MTYDTSFLKVPVRFGRPCGYEQVPASCQDSHVLIVHRNVHNTLCTAHVHYVSNHDSLYVLRLIALVPISVVQARISQSSFAYHQLAPAGMLAPLLLSHSPLHRHWIMCGSSCQTVKVALSMTIISLMNCLERT